MSTSTNRFRIGLLFFSLVLSTAFAQGTDLPPDIRTVHFSECEQQWEHGGIIISGCTTLSVGKFWCPLRKLPSVGPKYALCDVATLPQRQAKGETSLLDCEVESPMGVQDAFVMGCFKSGTSNFLCSVKGLGQKPCVALPEGTSSGTADELGSSGSDGLTGTTRKGRVAGIDGNEDPLLPPTRTTDGTTLTDNVDQTASVKSMSAGAIAAIIGSGVLILGAIAAGILYVRRSRNPQKPKQTLTRVKIDSDYGQQQQQHVPAANMELPKGFVERAKKRSSSQYVPQNLEDEDDYSFDDSEYFDQEPIGQFTVTSTYDNALPDELVVKRGDILELYQEFDDGWGAAINLSRGNKKGVFPLHCID